MTRKIFAVFILLLIFMTAFGAGYDYRGDDVELVAYINTLCEDYELPPELIYAVIERESSWQADALNATGNCIGLMQISTVNLGWLEVNLGVQDLYDPFQNVLAGISMLASYVETYGDYHMALMCYNCGCGGAQKLFDQGIYSSTYSRWVVGRMEELDAASYPKTTDKQLQSYSTSADTMQTGNSDSAGQFLEEVEPKEKQKRILDAGDSQMLAFEQEAVQPPQQPGNVQQPDAEEIVDLASAVDEKPEVMQEKGQSLLPGNLFTIIHARDVQQEDPTRPVCAAVSAK